MNSLKYFMLNGTQGHVTTWTSEHDAGATDLVTEDNLRRLLGVPIYFFSGSENAVYSPESTDASYTTLRDLGDESQYERDVFDGFGHLDCWMGEKALHVIWPKVREHIKKASKIPGGKTLIPA